MKIPRQHPPARPVAPGTQVASFWVDDSGSKLTLNECFVMGAIKTRHADDLQRAIHRVRERHNYFDEFKFGRIKPRNYPVFCDLVDVLEKSDAHLAAVVVDGTVHNPFAGREVWETHADVVSRLVARNLNLGEIAVVHVDRIHTPEGRSIGDLVKKKVNGSRRAITVVHAVSLDSKSNQLLQAADLVAGAIFHERVARRTKSSEKAKIASRLATAFEVPDLSDRRTKRVNIATMSAPPVPPQRSAPRGRQSPRSLVSTRARAGTVDTRRG